MLNYLSVKAGQLHIDIGRYNGSAKLYRYAAVKLYAKNLVLRFTHRVRHVRPDRSSKTYYHYSEIRAQAQQILCIHLANAG